MPLRWTVIEIFKYVEKGSDDEEENLMTNNTDYFDSLVYTNKIQEVHLFKDFPFVFT